MKLTWLETLALGTDEFSSELTKSRFCIPQAEHGPCSHGATQLHNFSCVVLPSPHTTPSSRQALHSPGWVVHLGLPPLSLLFAPYRVHQTRLKRWKITSTLTTLAVSLGVREHEREISFS